jgi:Co/Zn/Cd efflux system component
MNTLTTGEKQQRGTLLAVLILNAALFVGLGAGGLLADSSALLANAADNASDTAVYVLAFLAVGRGLAWKRRAARVSGVLLLLFAAAVIADVVRRWFVGAEPFGPTMMTLALIAAGVNLLCLYLLRRNRSEEVHMRAAETFSFNDFAANGGILVAGGLVMWLRQPWPDLVVGALVAAIAVKGGLEILKDARAEQEG